MKKQTKKFKRLFFDIETSCNIVYTWNVGYKLNIGHENIIKERSIICLCYKWEGESKVHSLQWNKGDDKQLILDFCKVINNADEVIGHNSDRYDIPWFRTRCVYHGVKSLPEFTSMDTLKIARSKFRFNSNRLDYISRFLGFGGKRDTGGFKLWKEIMEDNSVIAMNKMIKYCKKDVTILEKVHEKLKMYTPSKTHIGIINGNTSCDCPNCGSTKTITNGLRVSAKGIRNRKMYCSGSCGKYFTVSETVFNKSRNIK